MADTYNVVRTDGVFFEGMTREQIYELVHGTTGKIPEGIDEAFITKLKEANKGDVVRMWVGTNAEYNALEAKLDDVLYIITDDTFYEDLEEEMRTTRNGIETNMEQAINDALQEVRDWMNYVTEELQA